MRRRPGPTARAGPAVLPSHPAAPEEVAMLRPTAVAPPIAHLIGPGKLKLAAGRLVFVTPDRSQPALDTRRLRAVYCYGPVGITDEALALLFRSEIAVAWLTPG